MLKYRETAHSLVNRTGKQLKFLSAISLGQKLDERHLKIIEIQDFSAVPYTKQDKSQVKRQSLAINRKVIIHDQKKVDIEERRLRLELEIEERKMSLKECDIALRKAVAEVEAIVIANEKAKLALKNN
ncbi:unnamed protein product [Rhizophagus irregularis]|nr:unnamed protein product [Rhizophagus irregularis]CAB5389450.1 unnamed protein product [Rhizophagus irregularis]